MDTTALDVARLASLDTRVTALENEVRNDIKDLKVDVAALRDELRGRPSWAVTAYLTASTSAVVGLAVYVLSNRPGS